MRYVNPLVVGSSPTPVTWDKTDQRETSRGKTRCIPRVWPVSTQKHSISPSGQQETPQDAESLPSATDWLPTDSDLVAVVNAWDRLPKVIRAGIVAMVKASERLLTA